MGLSLWAFRVKEYGSLGPVDHLSEVVPYPTIPSTRTPASKVPANVVRPAAGGAALRPKVSGTWQEEIIAAKIRGFRTASLGGARLDDRPESQGTGNETGDRNINSHLPY